MESPTENPQTVGMPMSSLNTAQCDQALALARASLHRQGIHRDDNEDLANACLEHILEDLKQHPQTDRSPEDWMAWLTNAVRSWMQHGIRAHRQRCNREVPWPVASEAKGEAAPLLEPLSHAPSPEAEAIRAELRLRIEQAISKAHLSPDQSALLEALLEGERAVDIARRQLCKPEAIRQRIRTLRIRLRNVLLDAGFSEAEVDDYLSLIRSESGPR